MTLRQLDFFAVPVDDAAPGGAGCWGATMATTPDDIKIIAQFLASRGQSPGAWEPYKREAFQLRRALKDRGGFKFTRRIEPPAHASR